MAHQKVAEPLSGADLGSGSGPDPGCGAGLPAVDGRQASAGGYVIAVSDTQIAAPAVTRALVQAGADVLSVGESRHSAGGSRRLRSSGSVSSPAPGDRLWPPRRVTRQPGEGPSVPGRGLHLSFDAMSG
jgi:hypothetical protein